MSETCCVGHGWAQLSGSRVVEMYSVGCTTTLQDSRWWKQMWTSPAQFADSFSFTVLLLYSAVSKTHSGSARHTDSLDSHKLPVPWETVSTGFNCRDWSPGRPFGETIPPLVSTRTLLPWCRVEIPLLEGWRVGVNTLVHTTPLRTL